jgi:hypothetical protein
LTTRSPSASPSSGPRHYAVLNYKIALSLALELITSETFGSVLDHKIALSLALELITSETFGSVLDHKIALSLALALALALALELISSETFRSILDHKISFSLTFELIRIIISHSPTSSFCNLQTALAFPNVNKRANIRTDLAALSRRRQTRSSSRRWERYLP